MFEEKWILWQPAMTRSVVGLRSSKALPKVKLAPKKGHGHCWWCVAHLIHYSFLNSEDTITHLRNTLSKFMRCTKNFSACSQHWSIEWAQFFSTTMPDCMPHNQCFKSSTNWAMKVCKNTGMGCHFVLQGIFPTQGWNPGLLHFRQILYCLSHQGSLLFLWPSTSASRNLFKGANQKYSSPILFSTGLNGGVKVEVVLFA